MKHFWTIGILTTVLGFIVCQFGFFYDQVNAFVTMIGRNTAVSRAYKMIDQAQSEADSLQERSRELRIKARTMEFGLEREEENLAKCEFAIKQLAKTLKKAGLPKPSQMEKLTDKQKQKKIIFCGKEGSAMDAYNQISKWTTEYLRKKSVLDVKRKLIEKQRECASQMLSQQGELYAVIEKIKVQLANLEAEREIAAIDAELAELYAAERGVDVGRIGKILDTIQTDIDNLKARAEEAKNQIGKPTNGDVYSMPEISSEPNESSYLDAQWD